MNLRWNLGLAAAAAASALLAGCGGPSRDPVARPPSVAPSAQSAGGRLALDGPRADPMYRELLAVDLPTVVGVARARSLDVEQARARVQAAAGRYESSFGAIFPVVGVQAGFEHVEGRVRAVNGPLLGADFSAFAPAALIQWAINPGRVYYDIVAARKRLEAAEHGERQAEQETLRTASVQYYDLVLAQARLAAAHRAVAEGEELLRITRLRFQAGAGLEADTLRSEADLSRRQQDQAIAVGAFYEASVALAVTLHLDATVTLVPRPEEVRQVTLVRDDLEVDEMMRLAVEWRPDLQGVRSLIGAAAADRGGATWGALGPQLQVGYQYGGISSDTANQNFPLHEQQRFSASAGWAFGLSTLGQLKTASAAERQAAIEGARQLDVARAQVVRAAQAGRTQAKLIPMAARQVEAADAALRLAQANLRAGTTLALDVLQASDAVDQARLRYADAVVRYNQSQVNLLAALGVIEAARLTATVDASPAPTSRPATRPTTAPAD